MENSNSVTRLLRDDHKKVRGLLRQIEAIDLRAHEMVAGVSKQLFMELEIHSQIEESFFYPVANQVLSEEGDLALVAQCTADHVAIRDLVTQLRHLSPDSPNFLTQIEDLAESVEQHMDTEESELFPKLIQVMDPARFDEIAKNMNEEKGRLLKLPQYQDSQPSEVQNPSGGEQKRHGKEEAA